jgi:caa(3)-type oxidase subunit IV
MPLGAWHLAVGGGIAAVKAALVVLFFMPLIRSPGRTWLATGVGLFRLGILVTLTFSDYLTRSEAEF